MSVNNLNIEKIILASGSKFRQGLLKATGLDFEVKTSKVDESKIVEPTGAKMALARAHAKAKAVAEGVRSGLVIGADQTLSFNGKIYDKASSRGEARDRLKEFSGNIHHLHSAVCIYLAKDGQVRLLSDFCVDVAMDMKELNDKAIEAYLDSGEWDGCVGCYQAENKGALLFNSIGGDNSQVIGLPMCELSTCFDNLGITILENPNGPWVIKG